MKKQKGLTIEELKLFAANYAAGQESARSESAAAVIAEIKADPKKFAEKAGQVPQIVPFLIDQRLIPKNQMMEYYMKISWLEHRDVILQLKDYESGKKRAGSTQPAAAAEVEDTGKTEVQLKAEWKTEKREDGALRLLSYKGTDEVVEIPEKIGKAPVREIGPFAFSPAMPRLKSDRKPVLERIRQITLPEGIDTLGESCFAGCLGLRQVSLPKGLGAIPKRAFADCRALESIELPGHLHSLGFEAFCGCETLREISLPDTLTDFPLESELYGRPASRAFVGCRALVRIRLPQSLRILPVKFLSGCESLAELPLPAGLEEIGQEALSGCAGLKTLELPRGLRRIGSGALQGCGVKELRIPGSLEALSRKGTYGIQDVALAGSNLERLILSPDRDRPYQALGLEACGIQSLKEFVVDPRDPELTVKGGILYTKDGKTLVKAPSLCSGEIIVPDGVERISAYAFQGCKAKRILLPESVRTLGAYCFQYSEISTLLLPDGLEELPKGAFYCCPRLKSLRLPAVAGAIGDNVFYECGALESIRIPGAVKRIGDAAFSDCKKLREVILEDGVEEIAPGAFLRCTKLEKIVIPPSVRILADGIQRWDKVFGQCRNLTIHGVPGSQAEEYARAHSLWIKFQPI